MVRTRYVSYWHHLEAVRKLKEASVTEVAESLNVSRRESYLVMKRLQIGNSLLCKKRGKPTKFALSKGAKKFLERNGLFSFLDEKNIYADKAREKARKRGKVFENNVNAD